MIAFYAAAADSRIDACLASGCFDPHERIWEEPIYRNVWDLLTEFGDAEIASLIAQRLPELQSRLPPARKPWMSE